MKTNTLTLRGALLRAALCIMLAVGLVPAQAFSQAFAAEADGSLAAQATGEAEPQPKPEGADGESSSSAAEDASAPEAALADEAPAVPAPGDQVQQSAPVAAADVDIVSASVKLEADASALIAYNGLTYAVNADDPATVALVGWTGAAPAGVVDIPERIAAGSATYTVTNISSNLCMGGGVPCSCV